jgi:hypothetical protein
MRRLLLAACAALCFSVSPAAANTYTLLWRGVSTQSWSADANCIGFTELGVAVGQPFSGHLSLQGCLTNESVLDNEATYSGFFSVLSTTSQDGVWGTFTITSPFPAAAYFIDGKGTFTITGGQLAGSGCPALICPSGVPSGGGTLRVQATLSSATQTFQGTANT